MKLGTLGNIILAGLAASTLAGCAGNANVSVNTANSANSNANTLAVNTNANTNSNMAVANAGGTVNAKEPDQYQAKVSIKIEAIGGNQTTTTFPTLSAVVARSGNDRRMEFNMPGTGHVVYLDKGGSNYVILADKRQYAEINKESTGFDVRRMMMPEDIVRQAQNVQGVQLVGDDTYFNRPVTKYRYGAIANTQTQAGQVQTESYLYVDKETGLPLHSETVSQAAGNVQGYNGLRLVTEITDITSTVPPELFAVPTDYQKLDPEQVKAQVTGLFNAISAVLAQIMQQGQAAPQAPPGPANPAGPINAVSPTPTH